jgi:hypothetical protein
MEGNPLLFPRINFMKIGQIGVVYEVGVIGWKADEIRVPFHFTLLGFTND